MKEPHGLVDHFFRHEYGRIVATLARNFGTQNLEMIEDSVQSAMEKALRRWGTDGVPDSPERWLYSVAKHNLIDSLRRKQRLAQIIEPTELEELSAATNPNVTGEVGVDDDALRLLFLCCRQELRVQVRLVVALKLVAGFSVDEISRALLNSRDTIAKQLTRAKEHLRECGSQLSELPESELSERLPSVLATIYLIFNEGYFSLSGESRLRLDLCDEAIRLGMLVANQQFGDRPEAAALVALMMFHSARFQSRIDEQGFPVLLEDQDRSKWNWAAIRTGMQWMHHSARGSTACRYHIEAAIAWEHCRAPSIGQTDWHRIVALYQELSYQVTTPMVLINWAVAEFFANGAQAAMVRLESVSTGDDNVSNTLFQTAKGYLLAKMGKTEDAVACLRAAHEAAQSPALKQSIHFLANRFANPFDTPSP